jgi:S-adenosylmethionine synthetase
VDALIVTQSRFVEDPVEVVERKGLGHPDTICDALAEGLSRKLCRTYKERFGTVLHHNVDKALLCGGRAAPAFGGGTVLAPIEIYLAGRAVSQVGRDLIPVSEIAIESARDWFRANMHALDAERHVRIHERIQPGSLALQTLFSSQAGRGAALANDTSIGVGHAPLSRLERLVLAIEKRINERDRVHHHPAWGEDVKVMGVRRGEAVDITIACAMIGRHLSSINDYLAEKAAVGALVRTLAAEQGFADCNVAVNAADDPARDSFYLTVTGTSAEAGDDGQVGRGNRVNGLITPCRPMSLEAAAGKNPVSHVGKIYNIVARRIAEAMIRASQEIVSADCLMVGRIGTPISKPAIMHITLRTIEGTPADHFRSQAAAIAADELDRIPAIVEQFLAGSIEVY